MALTAKAGGAGLGMSLGAGLGAMSFAIPMHPGPQQPMQAVHLPPARKRANASAVAPRPKQPKNPATELKRAQPSAAVFAATVAAHAAKTATLAAAAAAAASSESGVPGLAPPPPQMVVPLFASVVVPPAPEVHPASHPLLVARVGSKRGLEESAVASTALAASSVPGTWMLPTGSLVLPPMMASVAPPACYGADATTGATATRVPGAPSGPVAAQHVAAVHQMSHSKPLTVWPGHHRQALPHHLNGQLQPQPQFLPNQHPWPADALPSSQLQMAVVGRLGQATATLPPPETSIEPPVAGDGPGTMA
jgi:hypothetical protein